MTEPHFAACQLITPANRCKSSADFQEKGQLVAYASLLLLKHVHVYCIPVFVGMRAINNIHKQNGWQLILSGPRDAPLA